MAKKIVTLYIDDSSLRLLVTRGQRIKKWADCPLEPGLIKSNVVIEEAQVAARLKQLFKAQKVRRKKVIVGLSGMHCLTRLITLPLLPRAMLAEAVIREAKRVLPVPLEEFYISWQTIPAPEKKLQVFLVATPRRTTDVVVRVLQQAGLKPYIMELKPLALARVAKKATAIIIDIQPTEFDIVIMVRGVPHHIRTLPLTNEALSQPEKLSTIGDEINKTIQFYNANNPEKTLASDVTMFVSSGLADGLELSKSLSETVGYRITPLSFPFDFPEPLGSNRYLPNAGLVLKELVSVRETGSLLANLNVLPASYRPRPTSLTRVIALPSATAAVSLLILLTMFIQDASGHITSTRNQLDTTNQFIQQKQLRKKELMTNIAELEKKLAAAEASRRAFATALDSLDKQGNKVNGDLEVTVKSLSGAINLGSISYAISMLTLNGWASNEKDLLLYARKLDGSGRFSEVIIASLRKTRDDRIDFTLFCKK